VPADHATVAAVLEMPGRSMVSPLTKLVIAAAKLVGSVSRSSPLASVKASV